MGYSVRQHFCARRIFPYGNHTTAIHHMYVKYLSRKRKLKKIHNAFHKCVGNDTYVFHRSLRQPNILYEFLSTRSVTKLNYRIHEFQCLGNVTLTMFYTKVVPKIVSHLHCDLLPSKPFI